jgi:precorrin-8X/cobalt-precorrin-8 methylmutase
MRKFNLPVEIERRSFELIEAELKAEHSASLSRLDKSLLPVLIRMVHTTADFSFANLLTASEGAVANALVALRSGASIITDTKMAEAGVDKKRLANFGGKTFCFIGDDDVAVEALSKRTTRSAASMDKAAAFFSGDEKLIFAIGNAPTALFRLCELFDSGKLKPALVIGMPVGFVNVVESKECLMATSLPYITAPGRKGGSNVAAAVCNSLLREAEIKT